jgi:hypothetical protein
MTFDLFEPSGLPLKTGEHLDMTPYVKVGDPILVLAVIGEPYSDPRSVKCTVVEVDGGKAITVEGPEGIRQTFNEQGVWKSPHTAGTAWLQGLTGVLA